MARKKPHEEHENHERWLVSYADFITLLFAFFVVMYSISSVNEGKYRVLSDALVAAFRSSPKSLLPIQVGSPSKSPVVSTAQEDLRSPGLVKLPKMFVSQNQNEEGQVRDPLMEEQYEEGGDRVVLEKIADDVREALSELVEKGLITVNQEALWVEVEIRNSVLFPSGSAILQETAVPVLEEVAQILSGHDNSIRVEGFTDNVPISTVVYPSNWELSAARASSVVRLFMENGVAPARMVAQGYGEFRPVADNDSPEGRAQNRRVVIVVMADQLVEQLLQEHGHAGKVTRGIKATEVMPGNGHASDVYELNLQISRAGKDAPPVVESDNAGTQHEMKGIAASKDAPPVVESDKGVSGPLAPVHDLDQPQSLESGVPGKADMEIPSSPAQGPIAQEFGIIRPLSLAPFRLSVPVRMHAPPQQPSPAGNPPADTAPAQAVESGDTVSGITRFQ